MHPSPSFKLLMYYHHRDGHSLSDITGDGFSECQFRVTAVQVRSGRTPSRTREGGESASESDGHAAAAANH